MKKIKINLVPFERTLEVIVCADIKRVNRYISENFDCATAKDAGIFWKPELITECPTIWLSKLDRYLLIHEIVHLTWWMNEYYGLEFSSKTDEYQAYYIGWLTKEIYKKLKRH